MRQRIGAELRERARAVQEAETALKAAEDAAAAGDEAGAAVRAETCVHV